MGETPGTDVPGSPGGAAIDDNAAFLAALTADPAGDVARLVYADWLDEHDRPAEAEYLRAELDVAAAPNPERRERLWRAWAAVPPGWLAHVTQPSRLRGNPTGRPAQWWNFGLGSLRPGGGTYDSWGYGTIPDLLAEDLLDPVAAMPAGEPMDVEHYSAAGCERILEAAGDCGVELPEAFARLMADPALLAGHHSVTDCYFNVPDGDDPPVRTDADGTARFTFYCDSQHCVEWDLLVHPAGAHCVVASTPLEPEPGDEPADPRLCFVAPSFEAFLARVLVENEVWYLAHPDLLSQRGEALADASSAAVAYLAHYRR